MLPVWTLLLLVVQALSSPRNAYYEGPDHLQTLTFALQDDGLTDQTHIQKFERILQCTEYFMTMIKNAKKKYKPIPMHPKMGKAKLTGIDSFDVANQIVLRKDQDYSTCEMIWSSFKSLMSGDIYDEIDNADDLVQYLSVLLSDESGKQKVFKVIPDMSYNTIDSDQEEMMMGKNAMKSYMKKLPQKAVVKNLNKRAGGGGQGGGGGSSRKSSSKNSDNDVGNDEATSSNKALDTNDSDETISGKNQFSSTSTNQQVGSPAVGPFLPGLFERRKRSIDALQNAISRHIRANNNENNKGKLNDVDIEKALQFLQSLGIDRSLFSSAGPNIGKRSALEMVDSAVPASRSKRGFLTFGEDNENDRERRSPLLGLTGILTSLLGILLGGGGGDPNLTFDIFDDSRFIDLDTFLSDDSSKEILEQLFLKRSVGSEEAEELSKRDVSENDENARERRSPLLFGLLSGLLGGLLGGDDEPTIDINQDQDTTLFDGDTSLNDFSSVNKNEQVISREPDIFQVFNVDDDDGKHRKRRTPLPLDDEALSRMKRQGDPLLDIENGRIEQNKLFDRIIEILNALITGLFGSKPFKRNADETKTLDRLKREPVLDLVFGLLGPVLGLLGPLLGGGGGGGDGGDGGALIDADVDTNVDTSFQNISNEDSDEDTYIYDWIRNLNIFKKKRAAEDIINRLKREPDLLSGLLGPILGLLGPLLGGGGGGGVGDAGIINEDINNNIETDIQTITNSDSDFDSYFYDDIRNLADYKRSVMETDGNSINRAKREPLIDGLLSSLGPLLFILGPLLNGLLGGGGSPANTGIINYDSNSYTENLIQEIIDESTETETENFEDIRDQTLYKKRSAGAGSEDDVTRFKRALLGGLLGLLGLGGDDSVPLNTGIVNVDINDYLENTLQFIQDLDDEDKQEFFNNIRNLEKYKKRSALAKVKRHAGKQKRQAPPINNSTIILNLYTTIEAILKALGFDIEVSKRSIDALVEQAASREKRQDRGDDILDINLTVTKDLGGVFETIRKLISEFNLSSHPNIEPSLDLLPLLLALGGTLGGLLDLGSKRSTDGMDETEIERLARSPALLADLGLAEFITSLTGLDLDSIISDTGNPLILLLASLLTGIDLESLLAKRSIDEEPNALSRMARDPQGGDYSIARMERSPQDVVSALALDQLVAALGLAGLLNALGLPGLLSGLNLGGLLSGLNLGGLVSGLNLQGLLGGLDLGGLLGGLDLGGLLGGLDLGGLLSAILGLLSLRKRSIEEMGENNFHRMKRADLVGDLTHLLDMLNKESKKRSTGEMGEDELQRMERSPALRENEMERLERDAEPQMDINALLAPLSYFLTQEKRSTRDMGELERLKRSPKIAFLLASLSDILANLEGMKKRSTRDVEGNVVYIPELYIPAHLLKPGKSKRSSDEMENFELSRVERTPLSLDVVNKLIEELISLIKELEKLVESLGVPIKSLDLSSLIASLLFGLTNKKKRSPNDDNLDFDLSRMERNLETLDENGDLSRMERSPQLNVEMLLTQIGTLLGQILNGLNLGQTVGPLLDQLKPLLQQLKPVVKSLGLPAPLEMIVNNILDLDIPEIVATLREILAILGLDVPLEDTSSALEKLGRKRAAEDLDPEEQSRLERGIADLLTVASGAVRLERSPDKLFDSLDELAEILDALMHEGRKRRNDYDSPGLQLSNYADFRKPTGLLKCILGKRSAEERMRRNNEDSPYEQISNYAQLGKKGFLGCLLGKRSLDDMDEEEEEVSVDKRSASDEENESREKRTPNGESLNPEHNEMAEEKKKRSPDHKKKRSVENEESREERSPKENKPEMPEMEEGIEKRDASEENEESREKRSPKGKKMMTTTTTEMPETTMMMMTEEMPPMKRDVLEENEESREKRSPKGKKMMTTTTTEMMMEEMTTPMPEDMKKKRSAFEDINNRLFKRNLDTKSL